MRPSGDAEVRTEFAILGAGALGSILGAHLARAGHDVTMLARGRRAEQVVERGLCIEGLADFSVPVRVLTDPCRLATAGTVIVATKAIGTAASLEPLRHADIGSALSIQNGVLKDELLAASFGARVVLGALANFSGELLASGQVLFTRNVELRVGEIDGSISERVRKIVASIDSAGVRAIATENIVGHEWGKFTAWAGLMALSVTTGRPTWQYLCDPIAAIDLVRIVRESTRLAAACGIDLAGASVLPILELDKVSDERAVEMVLAVGQGFRERAPAHRVSALQDFEAGRPLEIEETLGHALEVARQRNVATPLLDHYYELLRGLPQRLRTKAPE